MFSVRFPVTKYLIYFFFNFHKSSWRGLLIFSFQKVKRNGGSERLRHWQEKLLLLQTYSGSNDLWSYSLTLGCLLTPVTASASPLGVSFLTVFKHPPAAGVGPTWWFHQVWENWENWEKGQQCNSGGRRLVLRIEFLTPSVSVAQLWILWAIREWTRGRGFCLSASQVKKQKQQQ